MSIDSTLARPMTMEPEAVAQRSFVRVFLPWLIAGAALGVYLLTLNHWISLNSLMPVARITGWAWQPAFLMPPQLGPLYWLLTYPFRWLPPQLIPLALNLFSMACAVLTLALLARSVALLPHDRTDEQRQREHSEF